MSVVSGLEGPSVHSESVTQPIHVPHTYQHSQSHPSPQHSYQHQRYHHSISEPSYHSPFHPPPCHLPLSQHQPPIQSHTYQHPHYFPFQLPLRQPSYQCTEPGPPRGLGGPGQIQKVGPHKMDCVRGVWGHAPRKF